MSAPRETSAGRAPRDLLADYVHAFASLDPDRLVPFYRVPCLFLAPRTRHLAADAAALRGVVQALMEQARASGTVRTEIRALETRRLAADLAQLSGTYVRFGAEQQELARFGFTYLLCEDSGAWKIAVAAAHALLPAEGESRPASP